MNPTELSAEPASFPDVAASFMLDGPAGKLETISDVAEPACARGGVVVLCHPLTIALATLLLGAQCLPRPNGNSNKAVI